MNRTCPVWISITPARSAAARASCAAQIQSRCGCDEVRRGLGGRRDDQEGRPRTGGKHVDPRPEQLLQVAGDGQGGSRIPRVALERPRDLEREERIAVRVLLDAAHERPRPRTAQAGPEHRLERADAQRPKRDAAAAGRGGSARSRPRVTWPPPLDRSVRMSPTGSSRRRRMANVSAEAVGRSSHWTSSTTSITRPLRERSRRRVRKAADTAPLSSGASGSSRSSAMARARRWGPGSFAASSS